jgi:D-sedoheptulose 7-phosphate isomerase
MNIAEFATKYSRGFLDAISAIEVSDKSGNILDFSKGIEMAVEVLLQVQTQHKRAYFVGNGGSAAIASHSAIDYWKNGDIPAQTFNDSSLLTCISNDIGFEDVFARPLDMFATAGDLVVGISSSGNSEDIVRACEMALKKECRLFTLSGFSPENRIRNLGDLNFYVPGFSYGYAEIIHQYILHILLDAKLYCKDGKDVFNKNLLVGTD